MLQPMTKCPSFQRLNNIPFYVYTTFLYPFILQWTLRILTILAILNDYMIISSQISIFLFFRYIPRSGIIGSYSSFIFHFLRNFHTVLPTGCTKLQHQGYQCTWVPFSPHNCQHLIFLIFFTIVILMDTRQFIIVALFCISLMISGIEHVLICLLTIYFGKMSVWVL